MTVFYVVCHGETLFNRKELIQGRCDSPLTAQGINQTKMLSHGLKTIGFDRFYSSPSGRARETAKILGNALGMDPILLDGLQEVNYGYLEGESRKRHLLNGCYDPIGYAQYAGEDHYKAQQRMIHSLQKIGAQEPDGQVLVVSHAHIIKLMLGLLDPRFQNLETAAKTVPYGSICIMKLEQNHFELLKGPYRNE